MLALSFSMREHTTMAKRLCWVTRFPAGGGVNDGLMVLRHTRAPSVDREVHRDKVDASLRFRQSIARIS
jgi:hypothetical protein